MWLVILVALVTFVAVTVDLDAAFINRVVPFILAGVSTTLFVSGASIMLAILCATLGALGRLSRNPFLNGAASFYVSFVRGTPLLLQILFLYLGLPQAGIVLPALPTGIIALGFNYGAYLTEIFRAGIEAVPHGQVEAAQSLGMTGRTSFRRVVVPQAFRIVTPAVGNDFIAMLKDSALISVIGVQEILWRAQAAGRPTFQSMQTILVAALVYWIMTILFSVLQNRLERRMAVGDRPRGVR
jgi:polar amino acid transport system permease protein